MKSIVFFDFSTLNYAGGCEKNFMKLGLWLKKHNYEVKFITATHEFNNFYCRIARQGKHEQNITNEEIEDRYEIDNYRRFTLIDLILPTKNRYIILKTLKESDVIYSRNEIFEVLILRYFFRINLKNIVFGFHTPIQYPVARTFKSKLHNLLYTSRFYNYMIGGSKVRALVLTENDKKIMIKYNSKQRIKVIPNPIDDALFVNKVQKKSNRFSVYYIGRMTEQKGIDTIRDSINELSKIKVFSSMDFYFIGSGSEEHMLKEIAKKFTNCYFLGFKNNIYKYYHLADITLVPSLWEGFPYSILEAQASGTPVISSNIPGSSDIVQDNLTGWLIRPNDSIELTRAVLNAYDLWLNDFIKFSNIGNSANRNVTSKYSENTINKQIEHFLFE